MRIYFLLFIFEDLVKTRWWECLNQWAYMAENDSVYMKNYHLKWSTIFFGQPVSYYDKIFSHKLACWESIRDDHKDWRFIQTLGPCNSFLFLFF